MANLEELQPICAAARAAWPGVELPVSAFAEFLSNRPVPLEQQDRLNELYLVCACAKGDARALEHFDRTYAMHVEAAVARMGPAAFVDEVKQQLRQRLFVGDGDSPPKVGEFTGRGALSRWVRAVAARVALNLLRDGKQQDHEPLQEDDLLGPQVGAEDPALAHMKRLYGAEFSKAFSDALATLEPEAQNYLRQYYLDGLGLSELGRLYHVSVPTASRRLAHARDLALEATRGLLQERLRVSAPELDSIMRLIQSRLTPGHLK